jgi:hypothetical protein
MDEIDTAKNTLQSRSRFQIENFVIGQHDTPEMQYYQTCQELIGLDSALRETSLRIKKLKAEIEELLATGKKVDAVEAEIKSLSIEALQDSLVGSQRELGILKDIFNKFPKYTRDQIEAAQPEYWKQRLIRVGQLQHLSAVSGVNWAQLEAIYQANLLPYARDTLTQLEMLGNKPTDLLFDKRCERQKME